MREHVHNRLATILAILASSFGLGYANLGLAQGQEWAPQAHEEVGYAFFECGMRRARALETQGVPSYQQ